MFSSQEVRVYLVALDLPPIPETRTTSVMYVGLQLSIDLRALHSVLVHVQCCSLLPTLYTVGCQLNRSTTLSLTNVNGMRSHGNLGLQSKREYSSQESPALHKLEGLTKSIFQLDHFEKENSSMIAVHRTMQEANASSVYIWWRKLPFLLLWLFARKPQQWSIRNQIVFNCFLKRKSYSYLSNCKYMKLTTPNFKVF